MFHIYITYHDNFYDSYVFDLPYVIHLYIYLSLDKTELRTQNTEHVPMLPRNIPDGSWQEIAANYLTHMGKEYLLVSDLFSMYRFLYKVSTKSTQSLHMCLQEFISQYGLPCLIYTNNCLPFASDELAQFIQHNHIDHITSSPYFPRSNGFAERQVRTLKTTLSTTQESKKTTEDIIQLNNFSKQNF